MCAGGCDEIMEKYGVGSFIVAFAEWGALPGLAASKGR
ncbi:DNA ligase LigB [Salmonella enterica subsp. enterica serovar Hvittingfoss str. A4-620]|nr:DNA ligase LigB [Salmonella enterica subsp. enterica serovar Hvittingfoss str. A4-620]